MSELEELKAKVVEYQKRIEELEKQLETFDGIIDLLNDDKSKFESMEETHKILKHGNLYIELKRIELYVNKKFGGRIDWNDEKTKYGVFYDHRTGKIDFEDCSAVASSPFVFISEEAYNYFIKVTGEHLVNFFKATH
jgi:hypothetical protein